MSNQIFPIQTDAVPNVLMVCTVSGTIALTQGLVLLNSTTPLAMTLPKPIAGPQSAGGNDGQAIRIVSVVAQPLTNGSLHSVVTPANGINGAFSNLQFANGAGESVTLIAFNGSWWVTAGSAVFS